ncbi:conserved oligomeric Golgi complex subunit 4 [Pieris rapae]|uniref:conserved oligomeric Golgi complex subunit 4 n=1 Tax=Pieris rapae TaxID=64459 RepID=UPI001E27FBE3|nr:conserved oligomeric Golgi complex subunit 4 [Pieris rapae]
MSIALLLEKYDVSTEDGLQKALTEIEKEESEVNDALSNALSKACVLEGRLRTTSQACTKLGEVKFEAQNAADMVNKTAALARGVSAKVRQLDLARSRVAECQQRVNDLIDLKVCSAGVDAAIKAYDYETAAGHISRFLSMEPASVAAARARGDADVRQDITAAANTLRDHLIKKFDEAAGKEDDVSVEKFFKLFPQIGCAELGVDMLSKYVAKQLEIKLRRCSVVSGGGGEALHADALTRVLEAGAAALERIRALSAAYGPTLPAALKRIQPPICAAVRNVSRSLLAARRLPEPKSPLAVEPALNELAMAHQRVYLYFAFLRRRIDLSSMDESARNICVESVEKIIADSDMTRTAQDILSHYLTLERYYLEESVSKALKLSTPQPGITTSSLVDDVFFIARKVIRRAVSTGSVEGVCCVVNETGAQLERAAAALRRRLAAPPPDPLPFPSPRRHATHGIVAAETDPLYFAHMTEAEQGAEWAERLADDACVLGEPLCRAVAEHDKLRSCAAGYAAAAATFRAAATHARAALRAALQHTTALWAHHLVDPAIDIEEAEEEANALPAALDVLAEEARAQLPAAADELLAELLIDLLNRAQKNLLANNYTRESGVCVERRCRRVCAWAGSNAGSAREQAARLAALAGLLAADRPTAPSAPLPPALVRQVLAARTDFKLEDIKRLKL